MAAVRGGASQRSTARRFRVGLRTVQLWVQRAHGRDLDDVVWEDRPHTPHQVRRIPQAIEDMVLVLRKELQASALGEIGAAAIRRELLDRRSEAPPSVRTIGRILERRGALDARRRVRRPPPPLGWYLPDLARGRVELDSFDVVQGLVIRGGVDVEVLNGISLHGGLVTSWPRTAVTAKTAVEDVTAHWIAVGLPCYAQFDNDTRFQGAHHHRDSSSRVMRLCLGLCVIPVFAPPRETGFQAAIESYNGRWQAKVWSRFQHQSLRDLQARSAEYVRAHGQRASARIEAAPSRRPFPPGWQLDVQAHPAGTIVYLRRTSERGYANLLGRDFLVDVHWAHRLVRAEVELDEGKISLLRLTTTRTQPSAAPGRDPIRPAEKALLGVTGILWHFVTLTSAQ